MTLVVDPDLSNSPIIDCGTGDPIGLQPKGSIYIRLDATTANNRLWIATDSVGGWAYFTSSA
jgi:hypothetical protein